MCYLTLAGSILPFSNKRVRSFLHPSNGWTKRKRKTCVNCIIFPSISFFGFSTLNVDPFRNHVEKKNVRQEKNVWMLRQWMRMIKTETGRMNIFVRFSFLYGTWRFRSWSKIRQSQNDRRDEEKILFVPKRKWRMRPCDCMLCVYMNYIDKMVTSKFARNSFVRNSQSHTHTHWHTRTIEKIFGGKQDAWLRAPHWICNADNIQFGKCGKTPNKYGVRDACVVWVWMFAVTATAVQPQ